jgi:hypothetical protein
MLHFAIEYVWNFLCLFFKDEITYLLYVIKFQIFLWRFEIAVNLLRRIEDNSYQIQNKLKKSKNFTIGVYYSTEDHSINQIFMLFYIYKILILGISWSFQAKLKLDLASFILLVLLKAKEIILNVKMKL